LGCHANNVTTRAATQGNAAVLVSRGVAVERFLFVLGVAVAGALGCSGHDPAALPKTAVFVLRYVEASPQALVADGVHPLIAELEVGLLDLLDDDEDRRLLSIDSRQTAGAPTEPLAQRLLDHAPKVFVPSSEKPGEIDSEEAGAEEVIETLPSAPISNDGSAEVKRYLEAWRSALALGVERQKLVEPTLRLFETLVLQARKDAHRG